MHLNIINIYTFEWHCTFIVQFDRDRSTGRFLGGRPFLCKLHKERAHMHITSIYLKSCLPAIFDLSTVFKQRATFRIDTSFSSTVASLSLHQWSWPLFVSFHKGLQLFISYINIMKSLFQITNSIILISILLISVLSSKTFQLLIESLKSFHIFWFKK